MLTRQIQSANDGQETKRQMIVEILKTKRRHKTAAELLHLFRSGVRFVIPKT
jgi:hypothetical protein